jgi:hypothetical protein
VSDACINDSKEGVKLLEDAFCNIEVEEALLDGAYDSEEVYESWLVRLRCITGW